jgi:D-tyrosyl-tRNA(Tyr) deacylase
MIAVIQRVANAGVRVNEQEISKIGSGFLLLLGVRKGDTVQKAGRLAQRCVNLRIFDDADGKFNLSLKDVSGEALVVSQFTLLADTSHGRRPSFTDAEEPDKSKELYEYFIEAIKECGIAAKGGVFGERMFVSLCNNGPVTIIMEE